ncbi:MAG: gliding motility-associated C-terminal domain-containing protein, partial [Nonlabens sp.]|nr:gliding motility-associated C-terminal domain-containing protein [Nonlabens sp.]
GCMSSTTVTITVAPSPDAGTTADVAYCIIDLNAGDTLDLFTRLTGNDTNGTWNDDDATGQLNGSIVSILNLATGSYSFTYTVPALGTCPASTATVVVTINDIAAPTATPTQDFCDAATVADLTATGNGIQWYADAARTMLLAPGTALVDGEDYYATQTDPITGCESASATLVQVNIFLSPNSGNAVPLAVCNDNAAVNLFTGLDGSQDAGGTWTDLDGTGALSGNTVNATGLAAGTYRFEYTVLGAPPCLNVSTIVTITVSMMTTAGTDATLALCSDNAPVDLFTLLGSADAGGTWSPALPSGSGVFNPATDASGTYTYTVSNTCNTDTAQVVVTVTQAPNAGANATATVCVVDGTFDLRTLLGGTPDSTGTWSPMLTSGTNVFDPAQDMAGAYTYTVANQGACTTAASATVTIQINNTPAPTVINANPRYCASENPTVMDLDAAITGTMVFWYDSLNSTTPLNATDALIAGATYYATQTGTTGCESAVRAQVTVIINDVLTAAIATDANLLCINDSPTIATLSDSITNVTPGLILRWYDAVANGNLLDEATLLTNGTTYYAFFFDITSGCESSVPLPVTVDLTACGDVMVPDGFSPNGDDVNDTFDIDNLNFLYPNFKIEIFNRYGNLVYEGAAATPRFDGTSNQKALLSAGQLPVGVYFYILNLNDNITKPLQGRLYLSR